MKCMQANESDMREKIMQAVRELIKEGIAVEKITVRAIAKKADVGVGLINYHFGSKDNLLQIVLAEIMAETAKEYMANELADDSSPRKDKLKSIIKNLYVLTIQYESIIKFLVLQCVQKGDMSAELTIMPLLRQVFGNDKNEIELRIIALQILKPIQVASLSAESFRVYTGINLYDEKQRGEFVDILVDNLV
ncbi:MAG: TetR/AcrR family transcriptional regulator [Candidatus Metalachnospira sp.]|nr:TetR/AcrR family transcriptional regulator [Candidatus Metalachnospira sp.]